MSSIKSMVGHSLGAIGSIEVAACALAIEHDVVPPTANLTTPDPECVVGHGIAPAMTSVYDGIEATLRKELARTTLEDVLRDVLKAA